MSSLSMITRLVLILLMGALAACGGGPSDSQVQQALQTNVRQNLARAEKAAQSLGGDSAVRIMHSLGAPDPDTVQVENVKVLQREALDHGSYGMHVQYDTVTDSSSHTATADILMEKTNDGWRALPRS